ncbi:Uncharacterized protein GBIM_04488 [Gryllus bimaculatus]|nr:Uncharacterized protein GBIM_04488 [Gryllus bimaculatus]
MGLLEDNEKNVQKRYQELCSNLNMDREASDQAWKSYETIRQNYTLEGDQLHWLGCALYVACRKSTTPTVGKHNTSFVEGNCVSLTRLLRLCKLSLIQFFSKSKKWADMASMPPEFRNKIDRLERNFAVSMVIFKKFQPIFMELFQYPGDNQLNRQPTSRKQRSLPCTSAKVFDFSWTLFICVKGESPGTSDDLVNSYHLLLACCDLIFGNALLANRRDIMNPQFRGLPEKFWELDYSPPLEPPCIIDDLCQSHDGIPLEAKSIKEYCWKTYVRRLFEKKVLKGDLSTLTGILDPNNFEANFKNINKVYEEHVLNVGDFDERIFLAECRRLRALPGARQCHLISALNSSEKRPVLRAWNSQGKGEDANADIGTPTKLYGMGDISEKLQAKKNNNMQQLGMQQLAPSTPLSGRKYLKSKEAHPNITPVSTAMQAVSRLRTLLVGRPSSPSETLLAIFRKCSRNPQERVEKLVRDFGEQFCTSFRQSKDEDIDFAPKRLQLGESLYYKLLENILEDEKKKKPADFDLSVLLENDVFHQSLFACCLEIVIYSYNSQRTFPWILEAFNLCPFHFYKVIEPIVRVEDQLSRDMVKHLNHIEEQILESMAWKSESPLWENIRCSGLPVPSCEDAFPPGQLDDCPCGTDSSRRTTNDRMPVGSVAKKRLFQSDSVPMTMVHRQVKPGQSLLQTSKPVAINLQPLESENGRFSPIFYVPGTGSVIIQTHSVQSRQPPPPPKEKKAKRGDSLGLFFRKFYSLASVRMQELCAQLELTDADLRKKIWTCFEHTIVNQTDLMEDRHLDQILMCAVYVICKVAKIEKTFTEIMRCYRLQPQADSHVYRSVLLCNKRRCSNNGTSNSSSPDKSKEDSRDSGNLPASQPSAPPTPTRLAGTSNSFEFEDRGDLIMFYNTVYVPKVKGFAVKFSSVGQQPDNLTLSPLPLGKNQPMSPCRRISEKHAVFIRSLDQQKTIPTSPSQPLSYCFSRSPAKAIQIDSFEWASEDNLKMNDQMKLIVKMNEAIFYKKLV